MRIGVLTTSYPRFDGDIAGNFVQRSCRALIARGHSLDVLIPDHAEGVAASAEPGIDITPITYLWPRTLQRTFYGAGVPDNLRRDPRAWLGLAPFSASLAAVAAIRSRHWDAVITHWALPCALAAIARPERCRHLSILHSADVHTLTRLPARRALATAVARAADHHWFTSQALREKFTACLDDVDRDQLQRNSTCRPMGVDASRTTTSRTLLRAKLGISQFTVLVMARLVAVKGIEHAIAAMARLRAQLVIAGDGPELERLKSIAVPFGSQVKFVGMITGEGKSEWLTAADAFVLPSIVLKSGRTEGAPTSVLEAMAHGCPVIGSNVGGIAEIIEHAHNGYVVPAENPEAIAEALQRLIATPPLRERLGHNALRTAQQHRWEAIAQRWESLLLPP